MNEPKDFPVQSSSNFTSLWSTAASFRQIPSIQYRSLRFPSNLIMSGQLLKQFVCQTRGISIVLADMVPSQGFYRPVEAVNSAIKNDVARKTEAAFKMPEMVPEKIKSRTDKLVITYDALFRPSMHQSKIT